MSDQYWIKTLDNHEKLIYIQATLKTRNKLIEMGKAEKPKSTDWKFIKHYAKFHSERLSKILLGFWKKEWKYILSGLGAIILYLLDKYYFQ